MPRTRKAHPPSLKARVAWKTAAEIARMFDVHPNLVANWKRQAMQQLPIIFAGQHGTRTDGDAEKDALYQQIGRLKVELDFSKKGAGWND